MSPDGKLTFGGEDQWVYDKSTKTYDLTRGKSDDSSSRPPLSIRTTQGPPDTKILISPSQTVLVIVDMQNFFLHPSCRAHPDGLAAVDPLLRTIEHCRRRGIQVVWLNWGLTEADLATMPPGVARGFAKALIAGVEAGGGGAGLGVDLGGGKGRCLVAGEWNAEVYGPLAGAVREGEDVFCAKNRMSGLWHESQPLWGYLNGGLREEEKKKTLLFTGVNTDQCVLGTLTDAYNAGFDCVMVEDCCATTTVGAKGVCLANIGKNYGFVIDSETLAEAC
ncbi:hypothetical protein VMCG_03535 [Cytospora schulzeri]|uniref:Isochorismatase-like domain-containing protein n=1 Tax=Cytospora schulzeri TaxID=448051 RepID=A0A423WW12_9PEZI|nr:hypothetical protein VMCG_03535 [Valsa malicola]